MGDQAAIAPNDWQVFRATGVAHLMSISGLHITMFAWGAAWLVLARFTPPPLHGWRRLVLKAFGADVAKGEVGEIAGRGPIMMPGYYKRPDLTAAAIVAWRRRRRSR